LAYGMIDLCLSYLYAAAVEKYPVIQVSKNVWSFAVWWHPVARMSH